MASPKRPKKLIPSVNTRKGKMVEQLAARLLKTSGVEVQTRVFLPPASGNGKPREIDILVTLTLPTGQTVRFAVECKNERKPIEAEYLDAFFGKLNHVGIPASNGIFVSRSRYRQGALDRAKEAGIRTLRIEGLHDDGLTDLLFEAVQSVVWLLANAGTIKITSESPDGTILFCTADGTFAGTVMDLIYRGWTSGRIPHKIGVHEVQLDIPEHWCSLTPSGPTKVIGVHVEVGVIGIAYTVHGEATSHALVESPNGVIHRGQLNAKWDETRHQIEVRIIKNEEELEQHCASLPGILRVVVRNQPLPRINVNSMYGRMYWPPSEEVVAKLFDRTAAGEPLGTPEGDFEGTEFARLFDLPSRSYDPRW